MTETLQENTMPINDEDVAQYLKDHPNFLQKNPDLCDYLLPPAPEKGKGVADFQSYMIQRLKADKEEVLTTTRELVENARDNMNNQQRIHKAVLRLLESNSFEDFIQSITMDLSNLLSVDITTLVVEAEGNEIPQIRTTGIRAVPEGTVSKWMGKELVMLQDNIGGIEAIYGGGATLVQSQILLRVDIAQSTPPAIIAFGSRDPNMFGPGQATDQILFLARVIERCFRHWLDLPRR